ncbi:hypothetical protein ABZW96_14875 [Nocardia sp. NPDC004168]|uniref:hypothetical protein n=1 Tax=Nocardia sp. NPDC004168 TaxID=3154452 RepID=UPI0033B55510
MMFTVQGSAALREAGFHRPASQAVSEAAISRPAVGGASSPRSVRIFFLAIATALAMLGSLFVAPAASAAPEYYQQGPAGSVNITLRPFDQGRIALTYDLVNTQGATGMEVTLTPVGLNSKSTTSSFGGSRASKTVIYPYTTGEQVSVGVHVKFLTSHGVQDNSANPFIVSYPR